MIKFDVNKFKIVTEKTYNKRNEVNGAIYSVNGIEVCRVRKYLEHFCSPKSNLRDVVKTARETIWDYDGISKLTGITRNIDYRYYFPDKSPNTNYSECTGMCLNSKQVKETIEFFVNSQKVEVVPKISEQDKTTKTIEFLNLFMSINETNGHNLGETLRFPENFKIFNVNSNAPITGAQSQCYDNALFYAKENNVPLCIGCFINKKELVEDGYNWVKLTDYNKVNQWHFIYPHAWNLNEKGEIYDITIYNDLEEYFYIGVIVDANQFKTGFGDLSKYLRQLLNLEK